MERNMDVSDTKVDSKTFLDALTDREASLILRRHSIENVSGHLGDQAVTPKDVLKAWVEAGIEITDEDRESLKTIPTIYVRPLEP